MENMVSYDYRISASKCSSLNDNKMQVLKAKVLSLIKCEMWTLLLKCDRK